MLEAEKDREPSNKVGALVQTGIAEDLVDSLLGKFSKLRHLIIVGYLVHADVTYQFRHFRWVLLSQIGNRSRIIFEIEEVYQDFCGFKVELDRDGGRL